MSSLLLALSLLSAPKELDQLQGTWASASGTVVVIDHDEIFIGTGEEPEFAGQIAVPREGVLQIVIGGAAKAHKSARTEADPDPVPGDNLF